MKNNYLRGFITLPLITIENARIVIDPHLIPFLMVLGVYGFLFEMVHPGAWLPGLVGLTCLLLIYAVPGDASWLEIKRQWLQLPTSWLVALVVVSVIFSAGLIGLVVHSRRRRSVVGAEGLIGLVGEITPQGKLLVNGEIWDYQSPEPLTTSQRVKVCGLKAGMKLEVKKI